MYEYSTSDLFFRISGAVKSNIGHLEGTSGIAGVIKTILALEKGVIPPNTNFKCLNPQIDSKSLKIEFPIDAIPWPSDGIRRASVNSFGFGGTNAHAVLDDAYHYFLSRNLTANHWTVPSPSAQLSPAPKLGHPFSDSQNDSTKTSSFNLLVWSAADEAGLNRLAAAYSQYFANLNKEDERKYLKDLSFTLNSRRSCLPWKSYAVVDSISSLKKVLLDRALSKPTQTISMKSNLGFVFTGQGAQWHAMGQKLAVFPAFNDSIRGSEQYLQVLNCQWSLRDEMAKNKTLSRINEPELSQTISTAVQIAIADLLRDVGVVPSTVVGHSSGEIAAAYCTGAISKESALRLAYFRGKLASKLADDSDPKSRCSMIAVGLSPEEVHAVFETFTARTGFATHLLTLSCINSPKSVTISGPLSLIESLEVHLKHENIFARKLMVDVGYHSPQMSKIASEYLELSGNLQRGRSTKIHMVSTVTGKIASSETLLTSQYWVQNMVSPVNFHGAMRNCSLQSVSIAKKLDKSHLKKTVIHMWLEIGPHSALQGPIRDILSSVKRNNQVRYSSVLVRNRCALETFLMAAGDLFCQGFPIDLHKANRLDSFPGLPLALPDLPQYPFNHSVLYWEESRVGKDFRSRQHGNHELLGTPVNDWNPLEGTWILIIRRDEMSWVKDHRINGSILYPAAGMLAMAIEAVKQLEAFPAVGYNIRNVLFHTPLVISQESVETQICLRPSTDTSNKRLLWYEFRIYFHNSFDKKWEEVCRGSVRADYGRITSEVTGGNAFDPELQQIQAKHERFVAQPHQSIEATKVYKILNENGLEYGPNFQRLVNIRFNSAGEAMSDVTSSKWSQEWTGSPAQCHIVHPTTLDGIFQLVFVALSGGLSKGLQTMVPTRLEKLWISNTGVGTQSTGSLQAYTEARHLSRRSAKCAISILGEDQSLKIQISGFDVTAISSPHTSSQDQTLKRLCYQTRWDIDPHALDWNAILQHCQGKDPLRVEPVEWSKNCETFALASALVALNELKRLGRSPVPTLAKYAAWMQAQLDVDFARLSLEDRGSRLIQLQDPVVLNELRDRVVAKQQGKLFAKVGDSLTQVLLGEVDPLQLIFADNQLVTEFYEEYNEDAQAFSMFAPYLESLLHKDPGMRILEIGAGTGGTTKILHRTLAPDPSSPRYAEYHFTDISPSFFDKGRERFQDHPRMSFSVLDIEKNFSEQGYQEESYDIVIASNVLHATNNLSETVRNARRLLKAGGILILIELTVPSSLRNPFIFATLPGWWLSTEDYRQMGPIINLEQWDKVLRGGGFSGTDLVLRDYQSEECHTGSLVVSTATEMKGLSESDPAFSIIATVDEQSCLQRQLVTALTLDLKMCATLTFEQAAALPNQKQHRYIVLVELEHPFLSNIGEQTFQAVQSVLCSAQSVLWVTGGGGHMPKPEYGMIQGLCRVLRLENSTIPLVTLALEATSQGICQKNVTSIAKIFNRIAKGKDAVFEPEYMEVDGLLQINRIYEARLPDEHVFTQTTAQSRTQNIKECPAIKLSAKMPGLDSLEFIEDTTHAQSLAPDEVEIEVRAIGVNFKDLLTVLGRVDADTLGCECSGTITRLGENCGALKLGDRVTMFSFDAYRTYARSQAGCVIKIPDEMTFAQAATILAVFCTAYYCLHEVGRLERGESILIHAASGGTGQAAIQIASHIGAEIYATVGSVEKKTLLMERYNIPEDHIFYSRDTSFAEGIQRMTGNRGVDVILNSLSGEGLFASWECIAQYGRFLEIGKKDINDHGSLPMYPFHKNALFAGIDLTLIARNRPQLVQRMLERVISMFAAKELSTPFPLHIFDIGDAEQAFRFLQGGKSSGKIVLEMTKESNVLTSLTIKPSYAFKANATYVISGGLGGLGRSISRWLVERGARNLILLSRSGPCGNDKAEALLAELRSKSVRVEAPTCDITCLSSLRRVLDSYKHSMPPVMGCFQASMVLKDATFAKMSFQDWDSSTKPKVQGSWNLHTALPKGLDFFILLSSTCGIYGNPGQSNYAAGNTYQNALAYYRVSQGEKATAIDLGAVLSEGFLVENTDIRDNLKRVGVLDNISLEELFALLDYYCDPSFEPASSVQSHVTTGLSLPATIRASGREVPYALQQPLFRNLHQIGSSGDALATMNEQSQDYKSLFSSATSLADAGRMISEGLSKKLSRVLGIPQESIGLNCRVDSYGVDSLVAIELRNWLSREMSADVAIFEILGGPTLMDVGLTTAAKSSLRKEEWTR